MNIEPASTFSDYFIKLGVPSGLLALGAVLGPKVWSFFQARMNIDSQKTILESSGLGGVSEVVTTLRNQMSDMSQQLAGYQSQLKDMQATLNTAIRDKMLSEQAAQRAQSDVYIRDLLIERLSKQVESLGGVPATLGLAPPPPPGPPVIT